MSRVSKRTRPNRMQSNTEYIDFMSRVSKDAFLINISMVQRYLNYMLRVSKRTRPNSMQSNIECIDFMS